MAAPSSRPRWRTGRSSGYAWCAWSTQTPLIQPGRSTRCVEGNKPLHRASPRRGHRLTWQVRASGSPPPPGRGSAPRPRERTQAPSSAPADASRDGVGAAAFTTPAEPAAAGRRAAARGLVEVAAGVRVPGRALYYSVAFLWGSFAPAVRELYTLRHPPSPALFNTARLLLSSSTFWPVWRQEWHQLRRRLREQLGGAPDALATATVSARLAAAGQLLRSQTYAWFRGGLELGLYVFLGNVTQVIGLEYTPASRAAFLVQLQTVFIPLLSGVFARVGFIDASASQLNWQTLITSGMAFAGVFLLSQDKASPVPVNLVGDALEVLAAFLFSIYVLRLDKHAHAIENTTPLAATKIAVQALCSIGWALSSRGAAPAASASAHGEVGGIGWHDAGVTVAVVAWTGLLVSAFTGYAQPKCQKTVSASESGVILATQPLFAAALSVAFLGERLGWKGMLGGAIILASTLVSTVLHRGEGAEEEPPTTNPEKKRKRH